MLCFIEKNIVGANLHVATWWTRRTRNDWLTPVAHMSVGGIERDGSGPLVTVAAREGLDGKVLASQVFNDVST